MKKLRASHSIILLAIIIVLFGCISLKQYSQKIKYDVAIRVPTSCNSDPNCGAHSMSEEPELPAILICSSNCIFKYSLNEIKNTYLEEKNNLPKLKAMIESNIDCPSYRYYWAPAKNIAGADSAIIQLKHHAKSGEPFNGKIIAEADNSTDTEQHLVLCEIQQVSEARGPPRNCETVAIITSTETWLRSSRGDSIECLRSGGFRGYNGINIFLNIQTRKINLLELTKAILNTLQNELDLSAEQIDKDRYTTGDIASVYIESSGTLRDSKILNGGWRESLDFNIYIHMTPGTDGSKSYDIHGIAHVLVCRQALGNIVDYHGLDDGQRMTYATILDSRIHSSIQSICQNYRAHDSKTIVCD